MITSKHIYLLTSGLFFIGASILLIPVSKNEGLITLAMSLSGLFLLMSIPWSKIKIPTFDSDELTGINCPSCDIELKAKDIESNICYMCGTIIEKTKKSPQQDAAPKTTT